MTTNNATATPLSVSQLTHAIKLSLEKAFPHFWLQGEISNFKRQSSGHLYFSLKDNHAQIGAVMFRGDAASLQLPLRDGMQVIVRGGLNVYPPSGRYQIVVREMRLLGAGELLLKLEELKAKLRQRGWFEASHKKPLPKFPKRIGIVTSPTGAAIQDILNILKSRFPNLKVLLCPVKVQGDGAAQEIAQAIAFFNSYRLADLLIVGRGGGSIEDLWAFNEEIVAEAIFSSEIPIISAVGHETDVALSDWVADLRAPTPTAAASLAVADKGELLHHLSQQRKRAYHAIANSMRSERQKLAAYSRQPLLALPHALTGLWMQRCDELKQQLDAATLRQCTTTKARLNSVQKQLYTLRPTARILHWRRQLTEWENLLTASMRRAFDNRKKPLKQSAQQLTLLWRSQQEMRRRTFVPIALRRQLAGAARRLIANARERAESLSSNLKAIDPKNLLNKGYAMLFDPEKGGLIRSAKSVTVDQKLGIILADGELHADIRQIAIRNSLQK